MTPEERQAGVLFWSMHTCLSFIQIDPSNDVCSCCEEPDSPAFPIGYVYNSSELETSSDLVFATPLCSVCFGVLPSVLPPKSVFLKAYFAGGILEFVRHITVEGILTK
jgi:hypothetical protein